MPYGDLERTRTGSRLIAFSLLLLLGINGFFGITLWVGWQDRLVQARRHAESLTESLAAETNATVSGTDRLLSSSAEVLYERMGHHYNGQLLPGDAEVAALLRRRTPLSPYVRAMTIIGPDGTVLNDSRATEYQPYNLSDRRYFTFHRDGGPDQLFIDVPAISRIDSRWFIGMSRRLRSLDGHFAGVINAVVDPDHFARFFTSLGVERQGIAMLFDRTGMIYARQPDFAAFVGQRLAASSRFAAHLGAAAAGSYEERNAAGEPVIVSYHALADYPLVVMTVLWRDQVLAPWYQQLLYQLLAAALANLSVIGFTRVLLRQVKRLESATRELTVSESKATAARAQLIDAIESMTEGFVLFDAAERIVLFNGRYRRMCGPVGPLLRLGLSYEDLLRLVANAGFVTGIGDDPEAWIRSRLEQHRTPSGAAAEQETATGEWVLAWIYPTRDGGRAHIRTDITYLKQKQLQVAHQEMMLRTTVENIVQGLCVFDAEGRLALWNRNWINQLDLPARFARVGTPLAEIVRWRAARGDYGPGAPEQILARRLTALSALDDHVSERALPDGRVVEVMGVPMPSGGRLTTYTDITARKRHEDELRTAKTTAERASEVKSLFLAKMSHELRTPFNAIIGFADMIATRSLGDARDAIDAYVGFAAEIRDSGQHLLDLLNNILDISKIESGRMAVQIDRFDLRQTLASALGLMRDPARSRGVTLTLLASEPLPDTRADERAVKQIVSNLLSNALKFTPEGGRITLEAAAAGGGFEIRVADTGVGIAADQIERLLLPFEQGDDRYSRTMGGTGLGLALVKGLVELHGGRVRIESEPGQGTTVTAIFPPPPEAGAAGKA
ncbi:MAG: PAS-domain containing protein [Rhodospirillaceae bacterium]